MQILFCTQVQGCLSSRKFSLSNCNLHLPLVFRPLIDLMFSYLQLQRTRGFQIEANRWRRGANNRGRKRLVLRLRDQQASCARAISQKLRASQTLRKIRLRPSHLQRPGNLPRNHVGSARMGRPLEELVCCKSSAICLLATKSVA